MMISERGGRKERNWRLLDGAGVAVGAGGWTRCRRHLPRPPASLFIPLSPAAAASGCSLTPPSSYPAASPATILSGGFLWLPAALLRRACSLASAFFFQVPQTCQDRRAISRGTKA